MSRRERTLSRVNDQPFNALRYIANALKAKAQDRANQKEAERVRIENELLAQKRAQELIEEQKRRSTDIDDDSQVGISINVNIEKGTARASRAKTIRQPKGNKEGELTPKGPRKGADITFDQGSKNQKKEDDQLLAVLPKVGKLDKINSVVPKGLSKRNILQGARTTL